MSADAAIEPVVSEPPGGRVFARALKNATSDVKGFAGLLTTLVTAVTTYFALKEAINAPAPLPEASVATLIVAFYFLYVHPVWQEERKRYRLNVQGVRGVLKDPQYFRLIPYEADDKDCFKRPDGAVNAAIKWIVNASAPVLYLAGQSGVGKSSLLNAAIAPALADSGWVVLTLRPHDDPFGAISAALLKPNAIWQKPPSDISDPRERVERAADCVRRQEKRLLLIIDQFEEALILCDEQAKANLSCFLLDFIQRPVDGLVVLLSLRAEYLNDIPDLGLPAASFGQNCFGVRPFTQAEAQAFIQASGLDPGAGLLDKVLQEAAEIEDMPDKVRPIVLNMFGLVIAPFKGPLPKGIDLGRLLSGYVERCLNDRAVRGIAVDVLRPLVTDAGTKRALPLGKIAEEARIQPLIARGCLILLANDGLVRALDKAGERWEVAHDFVARLLHPIIRNWRKSAWEAARLWLAPTALSLWLLFFVGLVIYYPSIHEDFVLRELRTVGLVPGYDDSVEGATFVQNGARINNRREFWRVTARLADLSYPVVGLTINNRDLTSLEGLPTLNLTSLNLNTSGVMSLQGMPALPTLTSLALVDTGRRGWSWESSGTVDAQGTVRSKQTSEKGPAFLTSLQGMPELPALTSLDLSGSRLTSFQGMPALLKLTFLTLDDTQSLTSLQGMPELPVLYQLNLENSGLTSLQGMPMLPRLEHLMLRRSRGLTSLQGMPLLPKLAALWLNEDSGLTSLQGMPELPALTHLHVENSGLTSLQGMPELPALTHLNLSGSRGLRSLEGIPALPRLEEIDLREVSLEGFDVLRSFRKLKKIRVRQNQINLPTVPEDLRAKIVVE